MIANVPPALIAKQLIKSMEYTDTYILIDVKCQQDRKHGAWYCLGHFMTRNIHDQPEEGAVFFRVSVKHGKVVSIRQTGMIA